MANPSPPPAWEPIAQRRTPGFPAGKEDPSEGLVTDIWQRYFMDLGQSVIQAPNRIASPIALTAQAASIPATSIAGGQTAAGLYRLTFYARITQAATVSSSLTVTLNWTDHTVAQTISGVAMTGNTTTTFQSGTQMVYLDAASPITYATTYGSVGATPMQYQLYVLIEQVGV